MKQGTVQEIAHASMRRCVGCGEQDQPKALLRFAYDALSHRLAPDIRGKLSGRGVSVHPHSRCLSLASRRGGFSRSLRRSISVDPSELSALAQKGYEQRVVSLLIAAHRNRLAVLGHDALSDMLRSGKVALVLVAQDAAERSRKLGVSTPNVCEFGSREFLGKLFGREELALIGILSEGVAKEILNALACVKALAEGE
ncbi:MAG: DUF448 domain-containing protein [Myxococcales bacterium]|nr:MAG: DUF448 domain-containing protein [Myxococcales bacterium]